MSPKSVFDAFSSAIKPSIGIYKVEPSSTSIGPSKEENRKKNTIPAIIIRPVKSFGKNKIKLIKFLKKIFEIFNIFFKKIAHYYSLIFVIIFFFIAF